MFSLLANSTHKAALIAAGHAAKGAVCVARAAGGSMASASQSRPVSKVNFSDAAGTEEPVSDNTSQPELEPTYVAGAAADDGDETELEEGFHQPIAPGRRRDGTYYQGQWGGQEGLEPPFRQPRPYLKPIRDLKDRQIPALREHPIAKKAGAVIDLIEHEVYSERIGDGDSGGGFHDFTFAPWDDNTMEDPFYNGAITEDEYEYPSDHEQFVYVPQKVRRQIYYLWAKQGWDLPALGQKFKMRTERVSMIINMARSDAASEAAGLVTPELDKAMTMMFARGQERVDEDYVPDHGHGLHGTLVKDAQLPEDAVPVMPWRGNVLKTGGHMPVPELPPKEERTFKSRLAIRDISAGGKADPGLAPFATKSRVFDYDGVRRPSTKLEDLFRAARPRKWVLSRSRGGANGLPFADEEMHKP